VENINIDNLSLAEMEKLEAKIKARKNDARQRQETAYIELRHGFMSKLKDRVLKEAMEVEALVAFVRNETAGFLEVMKEYGQLKKEGQIGYKLVDGDFKLEVKANKVKKFDERADVAAERLIDFLLKWIKNKDQGTEDPMYQLAMTMISRNSQGDLDYKQISNLYKWEDKFNDPEYSDIMSLFKESHVEEGIAIHYYFWQKDEFQVWRKIEISFNRF